MAFAKDDDSEDEGEAVPTLWPPITEEADVDWKGDDADEMELEAAEDKDELAVVTVLPAPPPLLLLPTAMPAPMPDLERSDELSTLDKSVFVLLAAVTSAASLPTRTVQGAEGDQCSTPNP